MAPVVESELECGRGFLGKNCCQPLPLVPLQPRRWMCEHIGCTCVALAFLLFIIGRGYPLLDEGMSLEYSLFFFSLSESELCTG